ncbi:MAG TPA: hypothetical protein VMF66_15285 [Candidatus Acidoferrum sp.]|nr:hypothetical protein [Candidatus Acidoferrum sp.]
MKTLQFVLAVVLFWTGMVPSVLSQQLGPLPLTSSGAKADSQKPSEPVSTLTANSKSTVTSDKTTSSDKAKADPQVALAAGTHLPLVLENAISTRGATPGDPVYFQTVYPVILNARSLSPLVRG